MRKGRKTSVRHKAPVYRYYQIQLVLQDRVESGEWAEGRAIPSERDLCVEFGVSRPTMRRAIGNLTAAGFLVRKQGKGTFVARPKLVEKTLTAEGRSALQRWRKQGLDFSVRVLSMAVGSPPDHVRRGMRLGRDELIVRIERLLYVGRDVIRHVVSFVPYRLCPGILDEDMTRQSLIELLRDKYHLTIRQSTQRLQSQPASQLDIHLMGISPETPVFDLQTVNVGSDGEPILMDFDRSRTDRVIFEVVLGEDGTMKQNMTTLLRSAD